MLVLIVWHIRLNRKTWARVLLEYIPSRIIGTSSCLTRDNGIGETNAYTGIKRKYNTITSLPMGTIPYMI